MSSTVQSLAQITQNAQPPCVSHIVRVGLALATGAPVTVDPAAIALRNNAPFVPCGVYIDNSESAAALTMIIQPLGYSITVAAGAQLLTQIPAIAGAKMQFSGDGDATAFLVDYLITGSSP